jgi:hypothetical protein
LKRVSNRRILARRYHAGTSRFTDHRRFAVATQKYLLLQRGVPGEQNPFSPAEMQEMYVAFNAWKEKFKDNIVEMGGRLTPGGKILTTSGVMDGPLIEAKEIVGGYMVVVAESYDRALEVAMGCPGLIRPGSKCEVREIMSS